MKLWFLPVIIVTNLMFQGTGVAEIFKDSMKYSTIGRVSKSWHSLPGVKVEDFFRNSTQGLEMTMTTGDCWKDLNSPKAVLLKDPDQTENYYFEVSVQRCKAKDAYAQVGLVLWWDADNYIRNTIGFIPSGFESVGEFQGSTTTQGAYYLFPEDFPPIVRLRMEVKNRSVHALVSLDKDHWLFSGSYLIPDNNGYPLSTAKIGILGVCGAMVNPPLFSDWEEGQLQIYQDDDFDQDVFSDVWNTGQMNSGWGRRELDIVQRNSHLHIRPYSGSDIFINRETYPFAWIPAPDENAWELETKVSDFDGTVKGDWNKVGIVIWQTGKRRLVLSTVSDRCRERLYCEVFAVGSEASSPMKEHMNGFIHYKVTDVYYRIKKTGKIYSIKGSYDHLKWFDLGEYHMDFPAAQIRLFASGDTSQEQRNNYEYAAEFDYIKRIPFVRDEGKN